MTTAKTKKRLYRARDKVTGDVAFCRAANWTQALSFITKDRFDVRHCSAEDMIGVKPEEIKDATATDGAGRPIHPDQQPLDGVPTP